MTALHTATKRHGKRRQSALRFLSKFTLRLSVRLQALYVDLSIRFAQGEARWLSSELEDKTDFDSLVALYPDLQRVLFIHIPKCGGTTIRRALVQQNRCAPVPESSQQALKQSIAYMANTPSQPQPKQFLQKLAKEENSDTLQQRYLRVFSGYYLCQAPQKVFFLAHKRARDLLPDYREGKDILVTTVREPTEILRSLVAYRAYHIIEDCLQPDSVELLESLNVDSETFSELAEHQPRQLTELILQTNTPPSLAEFLSADGKTDCNSVWASIKNHTIFIGHKNEQTQMLEQLFGRQLKRQRENASESRTDLAADFMAAIDDSWIAPFLDQDSVILYQKLVSSGVIGFWEKGGTMTDYRNLLRNS